MKNKEDKTNKIFNNDNSLDKKEALNVSKRKINFSLLNKLDSSYIADSIAFHMPGHKRNMQIAPYLKKLGGSLDITEIEGFDNLQNPEGVLKDIAIQASNLWNSKHCFLSVNGSTAGILASIHAMTKPKDKILVARNCHKSVYNAIELMDLSAVYVMPEYNDGIGLYASISPQQITKALEQHPDITLIVLTSPTYDGIISDIAAITKIAHSFNIPLMVDEAHGAHLSLHPNLCKGSLFEGADIVVHSLHKTLPSLTQSALVHINSDRVNVDKMQNSLNIFQSSSPSYLLLASISECIKLLNENGEQLFSKLLENISYIDDSLSSMNALSAVFHGANKNKQYDNVYSYDKSKLIISTINTKLTGKQLYYKLLQDYSIILEMYSPTNALAMLTLSDKHEHIEALSEALLNIDKQTLKSDAYNSLYVLPSPFLQIGESIMSSSQASKLDFEIVSLEKSINRISASYLWAYPPGIPYITPGELITHETVQYIQHMKSFDIKIHNDKCKEDGCIAILAY